MPTYDYQCKECSHTFEKNVPMKDYKEPQSCPVCNGESQRVMINPPQLKNVG